MILKVCESLWKRLRFSFHLLLESLLLVAFPFRNPKVGADTSALAGLEHARPRVTIAHRHIDHLSLGSREHKTNIGRERRKRRALNGQVRCFVDPELPAGRFLLLQVEAHCFFLAHSWNLEPIANQ